MIKTILIKRLFLNSKHNKKKLNLFANIAIFLILAALISSLISIYFETKLSTYQTELTKLELEEFTIQEWLTDAPSRNLNFKIGKFNYDLIEDNEKFSIGKTRYYFYLLTWYPNTIKFALKDIKRINNKKLNNKYKVTEIYNNNKETYNFISEIKKKLPEEHDEFTELEEIKLREEAFKDISFESIKTKLDQNEYDTLQINLFFQEYNNIVDLKKEKLREQIINTTKNSTDAIWYAFLLQLIIFSIVQIFELRELK